MFIILSMQDRQLFQLHGFLLRLYGAGGDQYNPDCWHPRLGSVVRALTNTDMFIQMGDTLKPVFKDISEFLIVVVGSAV